jgi:hypothetical protein
MIVIGICGRRNTGKDVAAKVIINGFGFTGDSLAQPIKMILHDYFGVPSKELWGPSENRTGRTREMLQVLGTEFGRKYDPDVWIKCLKRNIEECRAIYSGLRSVISDVRFRNEAEMIVNEMQGYIIKIERVCDVQTPADFHASETAVDNIPKHLIYRVIKNDGTLTAFKKKVMKVAEEIMKNVSN